MLALSVIFHHKAEQYVENVPTWKNASETINLPTEIMLLENAIHQHQNLYESMCQAYTEVRTFCLLPERRRFPKSLPLACACRSTIPTKPSLMAWT